MADKRAFDPLGGRFATPIDKGQVCVSVPVSLIPIILGALEPLRWPDAWEGEPQAINATTGEVDNLLMRLITRAACNIPECPECPDCSDCPDCAQCSASGHGGAIIESEEDMGQVVTDVQIVNGQIRVFFGPCCWNDLGNIADLVKDAPEVGDDPLNPDHDPGVVYSACGKAWAIVEMIYTVADAVWDNSLAAPWTYVGVVEDAIPGNNDLDDNQIISAFLAADILRGIGYTEGDIFDEFDRQQLLCAVEGLLADDAEGITRPQWDQMIGQISNIYGEVVNDFFRYCADAIGPSDMRDITKLAALDTTRDCGCPEVDPEAAFGDLVWARTPNNPTRADGTFTPIARTNNGLTFEYQFQSSNGGFKALAFVHNFDRTPGSTFTELTIALEPVAPADELMHNNWEASGCSNVGDDTDVHGNLNMGTGHVQVKHWDNGRFYLKTTNATPQTSPSHSYTEARTCPSDGTNNPGKLYRWKAHIVSINGVDTGIVPNTTW